MSSLDSTYDAKLELLVDAIGVRIRGLDSALTDGDTSPSADHLRQQKALLVGAIAKIDSGDIYALEPNEARAVEAAVRFTIEHGVKSQVLEALQEAGDWFNTTFGSRSIVADGRPKLESLEVAAPTPVADWPGQSIGIDR